MTPEEIINEDALNKELSEGMTRHYEEKWAWEKANPGKDYYEKVNPFKVVAMGEEHENQGPRAKYLKLQGEFPTPKMLEDIERRKVIESLASSAPVSREDFMLLQGGLMEISDAMKAASTFVCSMLPKKENSLDYQI